MLDSGLITPSTQASSALPISRSCRCFSRCVWTCAGIVTIAFFISLVALHSMSVYHYPREASLELAGQPPLDVANYARLLFGAAGTITSLWAFYEYRESRIVNAKIGLGLFLLLVIVGLGLEYDTWKSKAMIDRLGANVNVLMVAQDKLEIQNVRLMQMLSAQLQELNGHQLNSLSALSTMTDNLHSMDTRFEDVNVKLDKLSTMSSHLGNIDTRLGNVSGRLGTSLDVVNAHLGSMDSHLSDVSTGLRVEHLALPTLNHHLETMEGDVKAIKAEVECNFGVVSHNYIRYNGWVYATRDGAHVNGASAGSENNFAELPAGWTLAPATRDIEDNVVFAHDWDCNVVVFADGSGWYTKNAGWGSKSFGEGLLDQDGSTYSATCDPCRILIRCKP